MVSYVPKRSQRSILNQHDLKGPERKNVDLQTTFAPPLTASFATPQLLNGVAQGVGNGERIGRRYLMKSMQYRAILDMTQDSNVSQHRIVVVYDKQANGAAPIASDVFEANVFHAPLALRNSDRFVVIDDYVTDIAPTSNLNIAVQRYKKINMEVVCTGTGSTIAGIISGSVYMFIANNSDPTIGVVTGAFVYTRIRFTDI